MMLSSNRRPARSRHALLLGALLGVLFIVLLAAEANVPEPLRSIAHFVSSPLLRFGSFVGIGGSDFIELLNSKRALVEENRTLKAQAEEARLRLVGYELLLEENRDLKERFNRDSTLTTTLATILSRPPNTPYDTFIIDIGENAGLVRGQLVVAATAVVIGTVREVYPTTALVALYSSPGEQVEVEIGANALAARAMGRGSGNFIVRLPRGTAVSVGDAVTFPHLSPLVFALVEQVYESPTDSFITILFKNPVNLSQLRWVEVVSP